MSHLSSMYETLGSIPGIEKEKIYELSPGNNDIDKILMLSEKSVNVKEEH